MKTILLVLFTLSILPVFAASERVVQDVLTIGKPGSSTNKEVRLGTGRFRYNVSGTKVQFSHDGSTWKDFQEAGTGSYELFVLNGGLAIVDDFDGVRRAESTLTLQKVVMCAKNSGSGTTTIRVNYGAALASNLTLSLTGTGAVACNSSSPGTSFSTNDLMNVDLTAVASGAEDLSVKLIF